MSVTGSLIIFIGIYVFVYAWGCRCVCIYQPKFNIIKFSIASFDIGRKSVSIINIGVDRFFIYSLLHILDLMIKVPRPCCDLS